LPNAFVQTNFKVAASPSAAFGSSALFPAAKGTSALGNRSNLEFAVLSGDGGKISYCVSYHPMPS